MNKLSSFILLVVLCFVVTRVSAQHATFSYMTFPKFTTQQATSAVQKSILEATESLSVEQLYTMGEEGLGDSGTATMESSVEGVTLTMPVPTFVNEDIGLTTDVLKEPEKSVEVIKENVQMPTQEQAMKMTTEELNQKAKAIAQLQTDVTRDALAVALANVQISAEQETRQKELEETIARSTTLRGDIQARSKAALSVLGEVNRLLGVSSKYLGLEAAHALSSAQSSSAVGGQTAETDTQKTENAS